VNDDLTFAKALSKAKSDLAAAVAERDDWNTKIAQLKQTIRVLGELCHEDPDEVEKWVSVGEASRPTGLTSGTRYAFQYAKLKNMAPLTVSEVKELMTRRGFDFGNQANPIASLTTIVRRLKLADEIEDFTRGDGKRAYAWKGESPLIDGPILA
jgi:hypothetical protein